ncbi:MAG: spoIIE [Bacillales bacterium]|jgi:stage II sporulation protein E|nr:spoIIE [Bacillales bacterium]
MARAENSIDGNFLMGKSRTSSFRLLSPFRNWSQQFTEFLLHKGNILPIMGFLLGRAVVLSSFSPFSLPFLASVFLVRKDQSRKVFFALILGAITLHWSKSFAMLVGSLLFLLLRMIHAQPNEKKVKYYPLYVFISAVFSRSIEKYVINSHFDVFEALSALFESSLAYILTLIFIQSMPLILGKFKSTSLKTEEIICIVIVSSSVLTGAIGWHVLGYSVGDILSRYLILFFSLASGASIGTTVGVVTGLIFSLSNLSSMFQISLLAFSGLLGGLLKEWKKFGAAFGLIVATLLVSLYASGKENILLELSETGIATLLFLLTPSHYIENLAVRIPGTPENMLEQQKDVRKVRDVTAYRVNQFSDVFQALSESFSLTDKKSTEEPVKKETTHQIIQNVTEKTCDTCFKKDYCWSKNFSRTNKLIHDLKEYLQQVELPNPQVDKENELKRFCVKHERVVDSMKNEIEFYYANLKLKKKVRESRKFVAEQLHGVSKVMGDFARELQKERQNTLFQEEKIMEMIESFGIEVENIRIHSLEKGNVEVQVTIFLIEEAISEISDIASVLSELLDENLVLFEDENTEILEGRVELLFRSAKKYAIETGSAHAAKGGGLISGDSYTVVELGKGKQVLAISDGMGNGVRAHEESAETLKLLHKILASGIDEKVAIRSINSVLSLRTTDEIFSTLDLAMIDLQDGKVKFLKIGSTPSFILRGEMVKKVQGNNLPIGIIQDFDVDVIVEKLEPQDLLIMMSDGIFEGPNFIQYNDIWISKKLLGLKTRDPQEVADLLLEEVIRSNNGVIHDDMTVLVAKMTKSNINNSRFIFSQNMKSMKLG